MSPLLLSCFFLSWFLLASSTSAWWVSVGCAAASSALKSRRESELAELDGAPSPPDTLSFANPRGLGSDDFFFTLFFSIAALSAAATSAVHTPEGPRKSGIPAHVEAPAPSSTTFVGEIKARVMRRGEKSWESLTHWKEQDVCTHRKEWGVCVRES